MSVGVSFADPRRVVPRWRDSATSAATGELDAIVRRTAPLPDEAMTEELSRHVIEWSAGRSLGHAVGLVSAAVVHKMPLVAVEAAEFILANSAEAGAVAVDLSSMVLGTNAAETTLSPASVPSYEGDSEQIDAATSSEEVRAGIQLLRLRIRTDSRDALAWTDLARGYARLGQKEKAEKAIRAALSLQPNHRFVLRSAARYYVHAQDAEQAHFILRRSDATREDPWLLAAEIAVATVADRSPKHIKRSLALLDSGRFPASHTSELAAAIATIDGLEGRKRNARRLFEQALRAPNENTVAQVQWAARQLQLIEVPSAAWEVPRVFEARAHANYWAGAWQTAVASACAWLDDEPFSGRPIVFGSPILAIALGEHSKAVAFSRRGVLANPSDTKVRNALTFALAVAGQLSEAEREWESTRHLTPDGDEQTVWLANGGLIAFLNGDFALGDALYFAAARNAERGRRTALHASALVYWAAARVRSIRSKGRELSTDASRQLAHQFFGDEGPPSTQALLKQASELESQMPREVDLRLGRLWLAQAENSSPIAVAPTPQTLQPLRWRLKLT